MKYAMEGITTLDEVLRVSSDVDALADLDIEQSKEGTGD